MTNFSSVVIYEKINNTNNINRVIITKNSKKINTLINNFYLVQLIL